MMIGRMLFNTDPLPAHERFPAFCEEVVRRYTGLDCDTQDRSGFRGAIELQRVGAIGIGWNSTTQICSTRTAKLINDGDDSILVTLLARGGGHQTQHGNNQRLAPGDAIICDCGYPGELNFDSSSQFWNLKIPRGKIAAFLPHLISFAGLRLDKDHTARRLLSGYLGGSFDVELAADGRVAGLAEEHIIGLIALGLGARGEARETINQSSAQSIRRAAILREIEIFFGDPNLQPATIAARFGITPRYLHKLLHETGRSFSEHLLERRLERAAALLRDPHQRDRRIAAIAFSCGFSDLSYFNRAFRQRYGATPSDVREQSRREIL